MGLRSENEAEAGQSLSDDAALELAGKKAVLKREWGFWAVLGFSATTLCTWEATSALFAGAFLNGGPASVVYGFIVSIFGTFAIGASMAELSSISPTAGAQYIWTAEHSPPKARAFMSWIQGWVTILAWLAGIASVCFLIATMIQGLVIWNDADYVPQRWHATLIMIGFCGVGCLGITLGKKLLPMWETLGGILHVLFFFIIMIALLATSKKAPNRDVWATFVNSGGWPSDGVSFCLGFITPAFALAGLDGVVHMAEETHHANINIPRSMIGAAVINCACAFAYILTILYSINDIDAVMSTPTGYPIIEVFFQGTNNARAATAMMCGVIIIFTMALFGITASTSRLIWAFARDRGLPFSPALSYLTPKSKSPTRAVLLVFIVVSLLSLINIGSTVAFNALLSLATIALYFSYGLPVSMFTIRRFSRDNPIQFGPWKLGKFGLPINVAAIAFCVFLIIFLPFPTILPVTTLNMNWASVMFVGVGVICIIDWFVRGRGRFVGPIKEVSSETASDVAVQTEMAEKME